MKMAKNAPKAIQQTIKNIPWEKGFTYVKNIKTSTWIALGSGIGIGVAGGALLRQPEINKLSEQVKAGQSEVERLQLIIRGYHEQFVAQKAKLDILQANEYADQAKQEHEDARSIIMYQYAAKEYVEIWLKPRGNNGVLVLPEKEYSYYQVFNKVLNGETLEQDDKKKVQNYIYPKYKKEIEGLVEYDFDELLKKIS